MSARTWATEVDRISATSVSVRNRRVASSGGTPGMSSLCQRLPSLPGPECFSAVDDRVSHPAPSEHDGAHGRLPGTARAGPGRTRVAAGGEVGVRTLAGPAAGGPGGDRGDLAAAPG